jgi:hypothetical protein
MVQPLSRQLDELRTRARPGGGFMASPRYPDVERPDATAWGILALRLHGAGAVELRPARTALAGLQDPRGAVPLHPGSNAVVWPTPLVALAWHGDPELGASVRAAVGFLLESGGVPLQQTPELGHDMSLRGWSWVLGTHSWVEPTALALMALELHGRGAHERALEARRLLLDRCLANGGWNYGNTTAFGAELRPSPDSTGVALAALAGHEAVERGAAESMRRSVEYLEEKWQTLQTPLVVGWALLGLSALARRPGDATVRVAETFDRERELGPYDTALLGLLLAAAAAEGGLLAALAAPETTG